LFSPSNRRRWAPIKLSSLAKLPQTKGFVDHSRNLGLLRT